MVYYKGALWDSLLVTVIRASKARKIDGTNSAYYKVSGGRYRYNSARRRWTPTEAACAPYSNRTTTTKKDTHTEWCLFSPCSPFPIYVIRCLVSFMVLASAPLSIFCCSSKAHKMHQPNKRPPQQQPPSVVGEPKLTKIADLRPYMKGVNCMFIVLEKGTFCLLLCIIFREHVHLGAVTKTKDEHTISHCLVADGSASIHLSLWDTQGDSLSPSDIIRLSGGWVNEISSTPSKC